MDAQGNPQGSTTGAPNKPPDALATPTAIDSSDNHQLSAHKGYQTTKRLAK
jgi:hypothetical protein